MFIRTLFITDEEKTQVSYTTSMSSWAGSAAPREPGGGRVPHFRPPVAAGFCRGRRKPGGDPAYVTSLRGEKAIFS